MAAASGETSWLVYKFLRGVALTESLQSFEELVCFVASLSQKLGEVVASGLPRRLVGELGRLGVEDGSLASCLLGQSFKGHSGGSRWQATPE
jgi:hypothetical protein